MKDAFDLILNESLDDFMNCYKVVDDKEVYSNGTEFVPIFRVKQWYEYNNKDKEIEKLKELVIALWHNDNARFLNKEQIDLLNNIVFGNDEEDLGDDKE